MTARLRHTAVLAADGNAVRLVVDKVFRYWRDRDGWIRWARNPWPDDGRAYPHGRAPTLLAAVRMARATLGRSQTRAAR